MSSWTDIAGFCLAVFVSSFTFLQLWAFIFPNGKISERLYPSPLGRVEKDYLYRVALALEALKSSSLDPADKALLKRGVESLQDLKRGVESLQDLKRGVESLQDLKRGVESLQDLKRGVESLEDLKRGVEALEALLRQGPRAPRPNPFGDVELITVVRLKTN
jgi:hypothetical protein